MPPQILEDVTQDGSSFHWSRRSRHRPPYRPVGRAAGFGRLTVPGRYAETVASPSSQKRQGYAAASPPGPLTPTRGPVRTTAPAGRSAGPPIGARTTKALPRGTVSIPVSYTHLRAHETVLDLVCRLLLEKKKK